MAASGLYGGEVPSHRLLPHSYDLAAAVQALVSVLHIFTFEPDSGPGQLCPTHESCMAFKGVVALTWLMDGI